MTVTMQYKRDTGAKVASLRLYMRSVQPSRVMTWNKVNNALPISSKVI